MNDLQMMSSASLNPARCANFLQRLSFEFDVIVELDASQQVRRFGVQVPVIVVYARKFLSLQDFMTPETMLEKLFHR